ncbi:hypothetical protein B0T16DRAFT_397113 [Cercophora newfieldiana]|uniref:Uncharacterized protein n=1 Tax=Cercophora newfieldiana TaxID=92897 RepID=A0AA40CYS8_9PEZI|nr:hypothetical protein B0T16DRAFT_397113 [Cercophora newfieldiana]
MAVHTSQSSASKQQRSTPISCTLSWPLEPFSINSILRANNRERIYQHPLRWSSRHLELLNCYFRQKEAVCGSDRSVEQSGQQPGAAKLTTAAILRVAELSLFKCTTEFRTLTIQYALEEHGIRRSSLNLPFWFHQQPVTTLETDGVFSSPDSTSPALAYLDLRSLESRRHKSIRLSTSTNRYNAPVSRLVQRERYRLRPETEVEDPYIVAVLIALAQSRRRLQNKTGDNVDGLGKSAPCFEVHLLALSAAGALSLCFYTACIPATFLDRFDQPSRYFPSQSLSITYRRIPLKQTSGFVRLMGYVISMVSRKDHQL